MTAPLDPASRAALEKAKEKLINDRLNHGMEPDRLKIAIGELESIDKQLGLRPSDREERASEIKETSGTIRESVNKGRAEGKATGQQLFGDGKLGRIAESPRLGRAADMAEQQAVEGLSDVEEQILRERGERDISQQQLGAQRQLRSLASGAGRRGETRRAREVESIREGMRARRDLGEQIELLNQSKMREGLQAFGAFGQAADAQSFAVQQANIGLGLTERESQLKTEFANAGLEQSIESMGVQRTFQGLGLEIGQENQDRAFNLQQQQIDKPDPEPSGGKIICGAANEFGYMSDDLYNGDQWAWSLFGTEDQVRGYHAWARPLTKSKRIIRVLSPIANAWAEHMNFLIGRSHKDNIVGWAIYAIGRPICGLIGKALSLFGGK